MSSGVNARHGAASVTTTTATAVARQEPMPMTHHRESAMLRLALPRAAAVLLAASALAACSDSTATTDPTASDGVSASVVTADVANVAGDAAMEDVQSFRVNLGGLGLSFLTNFDRWERWDPCPYVAASQRFECPTRTRPNFTSTRSYAYADASGAAQSAFNATTTASVNYRYSLEGSITRRRFSSTFSRARDMTFSGLLGTSLTINGSGSRETQRSAFSADSTSTVRRSYEMTAALRVANVVVPAFRVPDSWPASGTVSRDFTIVRTLADGTTQTVTRNSVVTFNGTQLVPLTVNGAAFTLDLATGEITRVATT
jgi:hypothetical protein